jgi:hypothetical protein
LFVLKPKMHKTMRTLIVIPAYRALLPTSRRESRFSMAYSHPYS